MFDEIAENKGGIVEEHKVGHPRGQSKQSKAGGRPKGISVASLVTRERIYGFMDAV